MYLLFWSRLVYGYTLLRSKDDCSTFSDRKFYFRSKKISTCEIAWKHKKCHSFSKVVKRVWVNWNKIYLVIRNPVFSLLLNYIRVIKYSKILIFFFTALIRAFSYLPILHPIIIMLVEKTDLAYYVRIPCLKGSSVSN